MSQPHGWVGKLQRREAGAGERLDASAAPCPHNGILILDDRLRVGDIPGGPLALVDSPLHYIDLGGVQAHSLAQLGGSATLWAGLVKCYASSSGLCSVEGLEQLQRVRYLYLDGNQLQERQLLRLPELLPHGQLRALDLLGNPGCTPAVEAALLSSGLLARAEYLNGRRLPRG